MPDPQRYDKMDAYVCSVFDVFRMVDKKAKHKNDRRLTMIALVIYNYVRFMAKEYNVTLNREAPEPSAINLMPIFEYVAFNDIQLLDFETVHVSDLDTSKREDLERYVLSHIYYLTQK